MSLSNIHINFKSGNPKDLAQQIGKSGITKLLEVVCQAYLNLCKNKLIISGLSEDEITEEVFKEVVCVWKSASVPSTIIPINQKLDRSDAKTIGRLPTIDFCFRDRWVKEAFFGFECKILVQGNYKLSREYVVNGLCRYLQGKYCSTGSAGSMIGYIKSGKVAVLVQDIKSRVDQEKIIQAMNISSSICSFKEHYISIHSREKGLPQIDIHHLFFDFK